MRQNFLGHALRKKNGELFSTDTVCGSPSVDFCQTRSDHAQYLIPGIVTIGIIYALKVVDVDGGDCVRLFELSDGLIESATSRQRREFIVVRDGVSRLDD